MSRPMYAIAGATPLQPPPAAAPAPAAQDVAPARTVGEVLAQSQIDTVFSHLERDLVGLQPVKQRIRDIAALLVIDRLRQNLGLPAFAPRG